jgi:WD40 repeat protein
MSAERHLEMFRAAAAADPQENMRVDATAIADLAFGSMSMDVTAVEGRHLAMLSTEALELDLSDPAQRQFGDYELLELIGEGGMGVVYRAHQASLDRDVAVKLLAAGPWASKTFIERFQREAQNAARMQHPNIVAIYEVGSNEELHFFSMRLIRGGSLADLIKNEGKLEPQRAARLLRTIAEAVDYAHKLGVLHLDLKPANVLLDDNGNPHVADFGLARRLEQGLAADTTEVSGTPSYMAPEQCLAAQKVTPATDIWGLGAVLYELVTGRPPYLGASPQATLQLVVNSEPMHPREHADGIPRDLEAIVMKCLVHDTNTRYASARELADDLGRFLAGYEVRARPLNPAQRAWRWARREPKLAVTALLALIALIAGLAATTMQWKRAEAQRHVAQEQTQLAQTNEATSKTRLWTGRREAALRLQADGKAFEALPALIDNIEEEEKSGQPARIERREVGMILHQGVTLIDRMIIADASPLATALSPDGSLLAIGLNDISVRWYDTATLSERGRIDLLDQPTSDGTPRTPRLLRFVDNHRLRVTLDWFDYITSPANRDTILVDLDHAKVVAPPPAFADFADAAYSANGRYALLFDRNNTGQYWQVEPWQPLSTREYFNGSQSAVGWTAGGDGRHAITFRQSQKGIRIIDTRHPGSARLIEAVNDRQVSAWQESHDGARLAIGDDNGHVDIVDVKAATARTLPLPAGSAVTWIAFSEDDAWVAVARHDGDALAFDVASGNPLHSGLLQHEFELRYVQLSRRENLLIASGAGDAVLWRLPEQRGSSGAAAVRITANPTHSARAGMFWADAVVSAGLLATADMDGEVRLWRLPQDADTGTHAATLLPDRIPFDGTRLVDAAHDRIRVASVDHRQDTDWAALPEPATFAELVDGGRTLIAASGRELYVFDSATMRPRRDPALLPGTPNNAAIAPDGTRVVFAFGHNRDDRFEMRLQAWDPASGRQQPGDAIVQGAIRQMEFSPDGKRLLVVGALDGVTEVFDAATLARVGVYTHAPEQPVIGAAFATSSDQLWLVETTLDESESDSGALLRWQPAGKGDRVLETRALAGSKPVGVRMLNGKPLLVTHENFVLDPGPDQRAGPALRGGEVTNSVAVTTDGALLANAYGHNVQLYDAATFETIGPPLVVNWRYMDGVHRMAFDAHGEHLLALMGGKRRFVWNTPDDSRALEDLRRDAALLAPGSRSGRVLRLADAPERAYLRAHDTGAWPLAPPRPAPVAARWIDGAPILPRSTHTSSLQLDLTPAYSMTTRTFRSSADTVLLSTYGLPVGLATLDGVDYDIRGGVELRPRPMSGHGVLHDGDLQPGVAGIRTPAVPIAALHVLMLASFAIPEPNEREYARIRLHYRDGGQAVLSIRTQRDVPGSTGHDRPTPVGWAHNDLAVIGVLPIQQFSAPRLANPHPERIVESLDLEASEEGWSEPVFLAITAEPVIAPEKSGTSQVRQE